MDSVSSSSPPEEASRTTATIAITTAIARKVRRWARDTVVESSLWRDVLIRDDLVIGQPAHAWVSGQLARAWGNEAFPAPVAARAGLPRRRAARRRLGRRRPRPADRRGGPAAELHRVPARRARGDLARRRAAAAGPVALRGAARLAARDVAVRADRPGRVPAGRRGGDPRVRGAASARCRRGSPPASTRRRSTATGGCILALDRLSLALCHGSATTLERRARRGRATRRSASSRPATVARAAGGAATTRPSRRTS